MNRYPAIILLLSTLFLNSCITTPATTVTAINASNDRRTGGEYIDNRTLQIRLLAWTVEDEKLDDSNLSFLSFQKKLLIVGQVDSSETQSYVKEYIQRKYPQVVQIIDEMTIGKTASILEKAKDIAITSQVEILLFDQEVVKPTHVNVITEQSTVYLLGNVTTRESDAAVKQVKKAKGVKQIIKHFKILQEIPQNEIDAQKAKEEKEKADQIRAEKLKEIEQKKEELKRQLRELGQPEGTPF